MEAISFSGNDSSSWHWFLLVEGITFNRCYSFYWEQFLLVEVIPFSGSHSFSWRKFFLVENLLYLIEKFYCKGSIVFLRMHIFNELLFKKKSVVLRKISKFHLISSCTNSAETVLSDKISIPRNLVKFRYFMQCGFSRNH